MNRPGVGAPDTNWKFHLFLLALAFGVMPFAGAWGMLSVPLIAWVVARWTIMAISGAKRDAELRAYREWNGRYFAYDDGQVRIHWDDDGIWLVAADVFRAMGRAPDAIERRKLSVRLGAGGYGRPPGIEADCFSEGGVLRYLASLKEEETRRFRRWLEREVFPNIRRLREADADNYKRYRTDAVPPTERGGGCTPGSRP